MHTALCVYSIYFPIWSIALIDAAQVLFFEDVESVKELNPRFAKMSEENLECVFLSNQLRQGPNADRVSQGTITVAACINTSVSRFPTICLLDSLSDLTVTVWTALEAEGLGCNLQHYQNMMHEEMYAQWDIPATWQAKTQLVFGKPLSGPLVDKEKIFRDIEDCIKVYGQ